MQRVFLLQPNTSFCGVEKKTSTLLFSPIFLGTHRNVLCAVDWCYLKFECICEFCYFSIFFQCSRVLFCGEDERSAVESFLYVAKHLEKCLLLSNRSLNCFALSPHQTKPPALLRRTFADQIFVLLRLATGKKGKLKNGLNLKSHVEIPPGTCEKQLKNKQLI